MGGAKNCPETPRQKMIGMMYLVLTAMLALNVSADILNGFTKLRNSMESSMKSTSNRTADIMKTFEEQYSKEGGEKKYGEWWVIAQAVHEAAGDFYNYVDNFKLDIINMIDNKHYTSMTEVEEVKNSGDTNKPHEYALNKFAGDSCRAKEFKERMNVFRRYVTEAESECLVNKIAHDPKFKHDWELKIEMMNALFSTDDVESTESEGQKISWERSTFDEMPAGAVLALLTKYQNDIRVVENDLINFMFSAAGSSDFVVNKVEPVIIPSDGEYFLPGGTYRAKIASAMLDTNQVPRVFVNGVELGPDGVYTTGVGGVGEHIYNGYMLIGDDTTHYTFKGKYTVGAPDYSASISNLDLNVLYKGFSHTFSIVASGVDNNKISVSGSNCSVSRNGHNWTVKTTANEGSTAKISVTGVTKEGKSIQLGSQEFRVKNLPKPSAYLVCGGTYFDGSKPVSRSALLSGGKLVADYGQDALVKASFTVNSFEIKFPSGKTAKCGSSISSEAMGIIRQLSAGQIFTIRNISVTGPSGSMQVSPIPVEMN